MHKLWVKHVYRAALLLVVSLMLAGCAGQRLHTEGMTLIDQGRPEEGLAKLEEASKVEPQNASYRADVLRSRNQITSRLLADANNARAVGNEAEAQAGYERVLRIDPNNSNAQTGLDSLAMEKRHAVMREEARALYKKGELEEARQALKPVLLENPRDGEATLLMRQIDEENAKNQVAEPELMAKFKKPVTMQFRDASVKMVFEAISRASGINVLLDNDIRPDLKTSIFVKDVSVAEAIDLILMQSRLQKKIISENTLFIYPDTPLKNKDFQDLKIRSFHLTNADPKQMMALIKSMLKTKDIFVHEKTNSLVMRDTPEAIRLAEKMIADQDIADPEVMLEVEVLEITRKRASELGIKYPSQLAFAPLGNLATAAGATGTAATTVSQLTINGLRGLNERNIGVSPLPSVTLNAMLQDSDTNLLASPRIRVRNREKAKIMIGDRVPMITNSVTPVATGTPVVTGNVTYQDVGLKLDVEPEIHQDSEVTIKVGLEVSTLGAPIQNTSGSVVYSVGTRNATTVLRLKDGETQILAGLIQDDEKNTTDKVPGLGQLPIAGRLFSSKRDDGTKTEIVLSITPRIVSRPRLPDAREVEYWSGSETNLRLNPLMPKRINAAAPKPVPRPAATIPQQPAAAASMPAPVAAPAPQPAAPPAPVAAPAPVPSAPAPVTPPPAAPVPPSAPAPVPSAPSAALPGVVLPGQSASNAPAAVAAASAAVAPQVFSWQGVSQAKVGDQIKLTLHTAANQNVKNLAFEVDYPSDVLKAVDVLEGSLMKHMVTPSRLAKSIDQANGRVQVNMWGAGTAKTGSVVTLVFQATAPTQQSPITVSAIASSGVNGETLAAVAPVPYYLEVVQ